MLESNWHVNEDQVLEKTGRSLEHWRTVLEAFGSKAKHPRNIVGHLKSTHRLPHAWAHQLMMWYLGLR